MDRTRNQPAPGPAPRRVLRMRPMIASYWPPTQPRRTIRREDAGPSSLPTGHVEVSRYFEVERIDCPYERIIDKRMVGDRTEYLVVWSPSWIPEDLIHPEERSLEEDLAEGPGGPPSTLPNDSLFNSLNVYQENAMGLANIPISNMNPVMLQHSQLPRFLFDPAVSQPHTIHRTSELKMTDLMNRIAKLEQNHHGSRSTQQCLREENLSERTVVAETLPPSDAAGSNHDIPCQQHTATHLNPY
ncbi:hypothetical protein WR25_00617 [Diploscapter pachys]|uniref:Chromo domain-containing protein n=1 Tax=Diploscapter pachys TaxID=2018661 RepID=A0A2A2LGF9_9BILA|nr:hypothetical protein WR25_00617 [Diploscapter pachys]